MKVKKMFTVIALCLISVCSVFAQHRYDEDLLRACKGNSLRDVQKYLAAGADPNAWEPISSGSYTALGYACKNGNINIVKMLVDSGANVDVSSNYEAPLLIAAKNKNIQIVNYLLSDCKANASIQDSNGKTPLMYAISFGATSLAINIINNSLDCIGMLDNDSRNALHYACGYGTNNKTADCNIISLLLSKGADPYCCDKTETTPFMFCAITGQLQPVMIFLSDTVNFDVSRRNKEGIPALLDCIKRNVSLNIIELILRYSRNAGTVTDIYGDDIWYYLEHWGTDEMYDKVRRYYK